ncbi:MAG: helix-turn-helix domain-containing protein [Mycobacterium sp.]|uniref:helix-turn-helix domain-containing protein n=1 Tax=Mycobacterium sp. TaxID=1785 RepID=UPI00389ADB7E
MLSAETIAARPEFSISAWACRPHCADWSPVERPTDARLVLVRAGRFRRRGQAGTVDLDRTIGYLGEPDEEEQFAHPHGGDVCTSVQVNRGSWRRLVGGAAPRVSTVYVDARTELVHRRLLTASRSDVDYRLAEELVLLLAAALRHSAQRTPMNDRSSPFDRRLVDRARAAIHDRHPAAGGLFGLAALVDASPYRLSRAFPRQLGVSVTRYRNRVRVGWALDQLDRGEASIGDMAASLGFADQAHLTRTVRDHVGRTPAALRRVLATRRNG